MQLLHLSMCHDGSTDLQRYLQAEGSRRRTPNRRPELSRVPAQDDLGARTRPGERYEQLRLHRLRALVDEHVRERVLRVFRHSRYTPQRHGNKTREARFVLL